MEYGYTKSVTGASFSEVVTEVNKALSQEGFGVLTDIDVQKTLKEKLGIDSDNYQILGACNPKHAHKALEQERELGLLLPCNVIVHEENDTVFISAINPDVLVKVTGNKALSEVAQEVGVSLRSAINSVQGAFS